MKVLFAIEQLHGGGKERRLIQLANSLVEYYNIEVHISVIYEDLFYKLDDRVYLHKIINKSKYQLVGEYYKLLNFVKPDVVQCWSVKTSFYFSLLKYFSEFKFITSFIADSLGTESKVIKLYNKIIFFCADRIIGNSMSGLKVYGSPIFKSNVIYNSYDLNRLSLIKDGFNLKNGLGIKTKYVIFMGARVDDKYKDYLTFVRIAEEVTSKRSDVTFLSAGDGDKLNYYRQITKDYPNIKFIGFSKDIDSLISITDVALLCTFTEGISNFIVESMMQKKAVIATGDGGTKEIVSNGVNGYLFQIGDVDNIVKCINMLLDNHELRSNIGENAFKFISELTSKKNTVDKYVSIYNDLTDCKVLPKYVDVV